MESISSQSDSAEKRRSLVIEHAQLAAQFAETRLEEIADRLQQIEKRLGMTTEEIAQVAIAIYRQDYTR